MIRSIQVFAMLLFVFVSASAAQTVTVRGTVFDKQGAVIPGTVILFVDQDAKKFTVRANAIGEFRIELDSGPYVVNASKPPFSKFEMLDFQVGADTARLDIELDCAECVTLDCPSGIVESEVDVDRTVPASTVQLKKSEDLPTAPRPKRNYRKKKRNE